MPRLTTNARKKLGKAMRRVEKNVIMTIRRDMNQASKRKVKAENKNAKTDRAAKLAAVAKK